MMYSELFLGELAVLVLIRLVVAQIASEYLSALAKNRKICYVRIPQVFCY